MTSTAAASRSVAPRLSRVLNRAIVQDILKTFAFTLGIMVLGYGLLVAGVISRRFDIDLLVVLPSLWTVAVAMLNDAAPIALLMATSLVYGRLFTDREINALSSFGLSPWQIVRPAALLGWVLALIGIGLNGFIVPEANYRKQDAGPLLMAQLRYLGVGSDRSFRFGDHSVWIGRYDGRNFENLLFKPNPRARTTGLVAGELSERIDPQMDLYTLFASRGELILPEELAAERAARSAESAGDDGGDDANVQSDSTFLFRLYDVQVFFADKLIDESSIDTFIHRASLSSLDLPYDPTALFQSDRRPKQYLLPRLWNELSRAEADIENSRPDTPAGVDAARRQAELSTELHLRGAKTAILLIYPILAALIALVLRSEQRHLPFFASCMIGPTVFFGTGAVGELLGQEGAPAWLTMYIGCAILVTLVLLCAWKLERPAARAWRGGALKRWRVFR